MDVGFLLYLNSSISQLQWITFTYLSHWTFHYYFIQHGLSSQNMSYLNYLSINS